MRQLLFIVVLLLQIFVVAAQKTKQIQFGSYNAAGILAGKSPVELTVQTVNGLTYKKWFLGAGFGLDNYYLKSLPLFASVRRDFDIKKFRFFLYADAGSHFVINPNNKKEELYTFNTKGKLYLEGGAGIKIATSKKTNIFFTVGNSYKNIIRVEQYPDAYKNESEFKLSRISIRAGFQF